MNRYLIVTALAVAGAFGSAGKASAQYVYGYNTYVPGAGVVVGGTTYATPFGAQSVTGYYSPFTGLGAQQYSYGDVFGNQAARVSGYNPWANFGYRSGYSYSPGGVYNGFFGPSYTAPYGTRYGYFYRR
ncbi:MAG: hypothetical protein JWO38_463 [Gemmataceae bacterium]|nr:hypothetical protein [Gemmataceae bacterium]